MPDVPGPHYPYADLEQYDPPILHLPEAERAIEAELDARWEASLRGQMAPDASDDIRLTRFGALSGVVVVLASWIVLGGLVLLLAAAL